METHILNCEPMHTRDAPTSQQVVAASVRANKNPGRQSACPPLCLNAVPCFSQPWWQTESSGCGLFALYHAGQK